MSFSRILIIAAIVSSITSLLPDDNEPELGALSVVDTVHTRCIFSATSSNGVISTDSATLVKCYTDTDGETRGIESNFNNGFRGN